MGTNDVVAKAKPRQNVLSVLLVIAMAIAVFGLVPFAIAYYSCDCCEGNKDPKEVCNLHPLSIEKQLEAGVPVDPSVPFKFQLFLSPQYANDSESGLSIVDHVHGIVYNANGSLDESVNVIEDGVLHPATFKVNDDHSIIFELKAGQKVVFDWPQECEGTVFEEGCNYRYMQLPFDKRDGDSGVFVLNELIGPDSDAAKAKYAFSGASIAGGSEYEGEWTYAWDPDEVIENPDGSLSYVYSRYGYEYETFDAPQYWDESEKVFKPASRNENGQLGGYVYWFDEDTGEQTHFNWVSYDDDLYYVGFEDLIDGPIYTYKKYVPIETKAYDTMQYWDEDAQAFKPANSKRDDGGDAGFSYGAYKISQLIMDKYMNKMGIIGQTASPVDVYETEVETEWISVTDYSYGDSRCRYTQPDEIKGEGENAIFVYGEEGDQKEFTAPQYLNPETNEYEPAMYWDSKDDTFREATFIKRDGDISPEYCWGGYVTWEYTNYYQTEDTCEVTVYNSNYVRRPLTITKKLDEDAVADDTVFNFALTVSPNQLGKPGEAVPNGTKVGNYTILDGNGDVVSSYPLATTLENQQISFSLKANWKVIFDELPFSTYDVQGTYTIEEVGLKKDENSKATYSFSSIECPGWIEITPSGTLGAAQGALAQDGMTTVTVANKQDTPPDVPEHPAKKTATVTISKSLEGVANDRTKFAFEVVVSPEWLTQGHFIGTNTEPVLVTGTIYSKSGDKQLSSAQYPMLNNVIADIELEADQYITFTDVPYESAEGEPGTIIVNELLSGAAANSYELKSYEVVAGKELGFKQAAQDKIVNSNSAVSSLIAPAGASEQTATGAYGEFVDEAFSIAFTNGKPTHEEGAHALTITKDLANFDFGKYESANVAFNVYRFDTESDCVAFIRSGSATGATWQGALAMRLTANGVQSTELTGLGEGFYAIEELAATNMRTVGVTRQYVQIKADDADDKQFTVKFDNSFNDQNVYENSIVNSYKKVTDKDGKITWQRYKNGVPVTK